MVKCAICNQSFSSHLGVAYKGTRVTEVGRVSKTIHVCDDCIDSIKWIENEEDFTYQASIDGYLVEVEL